MTKNTLKKLLVNALTELSDRYDNDSCNDLYPGRDILFDISPDEFAELQSDWVKMFPAEAKEYSNEMSFDTQVVETLIGKIKKG